MLIFPQSTVFNNKSILPKCYVFVKKKQGDKLPVLFMFMKSHSDK
jgi:hypothetical protein